MIRQYGITFTRDHSTGWNEVYKISPPCFWRQNEQTQHDFLFREGGFS